MKRYYTATGFLIFFVVTHLAVAAIPPRAANLLLLVELKLKQPMSGFRVQVMRIAQDVFVDPPPQADSFESQATFVLTLDPVRFKEALTTVIETARKTNWEPLEYPAYPRWRLRFIGPWNETMGDLFIDEENLAIFVSGRWYKVDAGCVRSLTNELVKAVLVAESAKTSGH